MTMVRFPIYKFAAHHYAYLRGVLVDAGCDVIDAEIPRMTWPAFTPSRRPGQDRLSFEFKMGKRRVVVDYANSAAVRFATRHLKYQCHDPSDLCIPFTKVSFLDWGEAREAWDGIRYAAKGEAILANWRMQIRADRPRVAAMLKQRFGERVDTERTSQRQWWAKFADCLVAVFVPGYNNHILDRGHIQALAFGICTIAPHIPDRLAYGRPLVPGEHYIRCADDYSDLCALIERCRQDRGRCWEIGAAARALFMETSTPERLVRWIRETML